jgi:RNA polymerase sigma-70 factor (ECF subfamily)
MRVAARAATARMADAADFERIAMPYLGAVYRAAVAMCRSADRADDLTQATLLKALERFETFKTGTNCKAWLLRILRNTWVDELRHKRVAGTEVPVREELIAADEQGAAGDQPAPGKADVAELLEKFSDQQVIDALKLLPEDQRMTLFLVDVEELAQDEVAQIMQVAVGTVKSRASRARANLRQRLKARARELGFVDRGS